MGRVRNAVAFRDCMAARACRSTGIARRDRTFSSSWTTRGPHDLPRIPAALPPSSRSAPYFGLLPLACARGRRLLLYTERLNWASFLVTIVAFFFFFFLGFTSKAFPPPTCGLKARP